MRCLNSSPLVADCIFRDNDAENKGGGIYGEAAGSMIVRGCTFLRNTGSTGGGVDFLGTSRPRIENCRFEENLANGVGGAVAGEDDAFIRVVGTVFEDNDGGDGGGVGVSACRIELEGCQIFGCTADFGGALTCLTGTLVVRDCTLSGDSAHVWGGAVSCIAGSLLVSGTEVAANFAAMQAGAVSLMSAAAVIGSCEIRDNTAGESKSLAGGIYVDAGSVLTIHGSRIHGNGFAVYVDASVPPPAGNADAVDNWWGDDTGPYHPILNPGGLGDRVSDYVDFVPWDGMTATAGLAAGPLSPAALLPNFPNPFRRETTVPFAVSAPGGVRLSIYDVEGRLLRVLRFSAPSPGGYSIRWDGTAEDGSPAPSGMYFCRMETSSGVQSCKMLLAR